MSKRHQYIAGHTPILPNPETDPDCIFYAPLTEGDLTDHKSGISWIPFKKNNYADGSATWDANMGAYKFYRQGGNQGQSGQWVGLNLGLNFTNWGFSTVIRMACVDNQYDYTERSLMLGGYKVDSTGKFVSGGANSQIVPKSQDAIPPLTNTFYTIVCIYNSTADGGMGYSMLDGVVKFSYASFTIHRNGGNDALLNSQICIGKDDNNVRQQTNVWCKDIRIYNRVLTLDEIRSL